MKFTLLISLCLVAANLHSYLYNSTSDSDPSISTSILRGKLPSFPKYTPTKKNKMMPTKPHCLSLLYICGQLVQAGYGPSPKLWPHFNLHP
ncbi:hypothetical protein NP493_546g03091 [Ridgeia piscesae]|uniref:Secreted protein n=1 Tax=Ridgeia piscesae TaxID=27915 RepID=A0AAD9KVW8_RIDPI|nr:hypothetical protein NP493_546g03091 [Ridgeia piscesae]